MEMFNKMCKLKNVARELVKMYFGEMIGVQEVI
jgi:hypothetical protein